MNELRDLSVTQVTHTELVETTDVYVSILQEKLSTNTLVASIITLILPALQALKQSLIALRNNALVKEVEKLDLLRDNAYIMFRDMVGIYSRSSEKVKKEACERILPIIEKAGTTMYNYGHAEQTARTQALFTELDKEERQADITELNALTFYTALKVAEENFENLNADKLDNEAKINIPTIKNSRAVLMPLIRDLLPTLRNIARTADVDADLSWIDSMNEKTDLVMAQVAARRTRRENGEE